MSAPNVPDTVSHADFLRAIEPLMTLLGVSARDVYLNGLSVTSGSGAMDIARISLVLAARGVDDDGERAKSLQEADGIQPAPNAVSELAWVVSVAVR